VTAKSGSVNVATAIKQNQTNKKQTNKQKTGPCSSISAALDDDWEDRVTNKNKYEKLKQINKKKKIISAPADIVCTVLSFQGLL
jgi:LAS superfamily LD-carboxypeptidase LdcB